MRPVLNQLLRHPRAACRPLPWFFSKALALLSAPSATSVYLCVLFSSQGCAFQNHREALSAMHAQGDYAKAAEVMDEPATQDLYGKKNQLLWWLDRGAVALALEDDDQTVELLERAESWMETNWKPTAGDEAARWLLDDTAAPYFAEPYEDMYVNVLKLLAQVQAGRIEGGATVEARRLGAKANVLRDRYLEFTSAVSKRGGAGFDGAVEKGPGAAVSTNNAGEFIESPLGTYLTAVTFMKAGDRENQKVAARRLEDSIRLQGGLIGPVREEDFKDLGERPADTASVLVVAFSGRGPTKVAKRFGPIPIFDWPVYFELPELVGGPSEVDAVRVVVSPGEGEASADAAGPAGGEAFELSLVEDLGKVAYVNHQRQMPLIYARTLLRSSLKAGASFAVTQAVRNANKNNSGYALLSVLAGLALVTATERADLRCWVFLPGQAHVGLLDPKPGGYRVRVEYLSGSGGVVYSGPWRAVSVPESGRGEEMTTIVEHYWR